MWGLTAFSVVTLLVLTSKETAGYVESLAGSVDLPAPKFEPQVAIICGTNTPFHSQYMTEAGRWVTDHDSKATCLKDKMEILEYCKKVYHDRDITNIVESSHYYKITNWCKVGHRKCKGSHWVKPYRCLEGPFQSDALLVPEHCLFDHIHNQTQCWNFNQWNATAAQACRDRSMILKSFAMLLPCGIDVFCGVEFVCCPINFKDMKPQKPVHAIPSRTKKIDLPVEPEKEETEDDDEYDYYDDDYEYDDEDEDYDDEDESEEETSTTTTTTTTTEAPKIDYYFKHFSPKNEHAAFKDAEQRLEVKHREKVTNLMKEWSNLENRYQEMRENDPNAAEEFKKKMTIRFQKTVEALEEEGNAEKRQLVALHQQRIMAHINEKKKEAMTCYTQALNENPPNTHKVQKCLQKLLRSLNKDHHHTVSHYQHLLNTNFQQAEREKDLVLEHLIDINKMVNQSLEMLSRYPDLSKKIRGLMLEYVLALRSKDNTPSKLLDLSEQTERAALNKYRTEALAKQEERARQKAVEQARKEQRKKERQELLEEKRRVEQNLGHELSNKFDPESMEDEQVSSKMADPVVSTKTPEKLVEQSHDTIHVAHAQTHQLSHNQHESKIISVHREVYHRENKSVYLTLAFAGVALTAALVVGIIALRKRNMRLPHNQGFVEVDQAVTPEEKHVANMQINGYENPTYKYFEAKE